MTNGTPTSSSQAGGSSLPFGDESPADTSGNRLPGILAGNEKALAEAIVNVVVRGGGLLVHGTQDGGAIGLHAFYGKVKQPRYAASPEALGALLEALARWNPSIGAQFPSTAVLKRQATR